MVGVEALQSVRVRVSGDLNEEVNGLPGCDGFEGRAEGEGCAAAAASSHRHMFRGQGSCW